MSSFKSKRKDCVQLLARLLNRCTTMVKDSVLHYLLLNKPIDIEVKEWHIDGFLEVHKGGDTLKKITKDPRRKHILFPNEGTPTNINRWDLPLLLTVLGLFENIDRAIKDDITSMRELRNKIYHWGSDEMKDANFDAYTRKIEKFVDNCCRVIGDHTTINEIKDILEDVQCDDRAVQVDIQDLRRYTGQLTKLNMTARKKAI